MTKVTVKDRVYVVDSDSVLRTGIITTVGDDGVIDVTLAPLPGDEVEVKTYTDEELDAMKPAARKKAEKEMAKSEKDSTKGEESMTGVAHVSKARESAKDTSPRWYSRNGKEKLAKTQVEEGVIEIHFA